MVSQIITTVQAHILEAKGLYNPPDRNQLGLATPVIRAIGKQYRRQVSSKEEARTLCLELFKLQQYEYSVIATVIYSKFVKKFSAEDEEMLLLIAHEYVNDWAVCDVFSLELIGPYIKESGRIALLQPLVTHPKNWCRRCVLASMVYLVRKGLYVDEARKTETQLKDDDDRLVRKAAFWLQRELDKGMDN